MTEQFITFPTAILARSKGFDEVTIFLYILFHILGLPDNSLVRNEQNIKVNTRTDFLAAPTQSLLQKWLRENHRIDVEAYSNASGYHYSLNKSFHPDYFSGGTHIAESDMSGPNDAGGWNTYEEALEAGLTNALIRIK